MANIQQLFILTFLNVSLNCCFFYNQFLWYGPIILIFRLGNVLHQKCVMFSLTSSCFAVFRHRRAIQKSRGSKVRRAEGTMESEPEATAATANPTGTLVSTTTTSSSASSTTTSSNTTASGVSTTSHTTTTAPPTSTSTSSSSSSSSGGSSTNTSNTSSSTTTTTTSTGRLAVPQISVYSGMPDRQTVQVSSLTMIN